MKKSELTVIRFLFLLSIILITSGCNFIIDSSPKGWSSIVRPITGIRNFPSTDTEYGKGFKQGCEVGYYATSKGLLGDFAKRKFDFKRMSKSPDYNSGWWDGFEQCTYITDWDVV